MLDLLNDVSEVRGNAPTPEAMAVLKDLHRNALRASNAPAHAMLLLQDQLAEADREARAATVERQVLTEALQERQRRIAELRVQISRAEADRSRQVRELATEIEVYQERFANLTSERDQLRSTILHLEKQLEEASRRHLEAEQRCELLERQLAAIDEQAASGEYSSPAKSKVLLVDSRPENIAALRALLLPVNQDLLEASSGEQALDLLSSVDGVSLILLSVEMGEGMDGFEVAARVKQRIQTRHIPIILLTAEKHGPHYTFRGYAAGAVDYISKPVDPWVLRAKVAVFVELYWRTRRQAIEGESD
ncbi:two-component system response regulator [Streptomyces sp. I5]|uniref:response regulator n=1 Tax=Streptomyces sp. I5 TaxID=2759947 RepID=UPI001E5B4CE8|nr:response regulator [Streptomyces sp. I5]